MMLSEKKPDTERQILYDSTYLWEHGGKFMETEGIRGLPAAGRWGGRGASSLIGTEFPFGMIMEPGGVVTVEH